MIFPDSWSEWALVGDQIAFKTERCYSFLGANREGAP